MPLIATRGAASAQGFGEFAQSGPANYIEQVFSTYLYTGNGSTQTITNGIDLSGQGGLVWVKARTSNPAQNHILSDTARGITYALQSNDVGGQYNTQGNISAATSTGFTVTLSGSGGTGDTNRSANNYASWTFRKQPKFFDVVTYTGNGSSTSFNVAHNLGSTPGTIIVKRTNSTSNWAVAAYDGTNWRVGTTTTPFALNLTNASTFAVGSVATSTTFNVCRMQWSSGGNPTDDFNDPAGTYVAYLFAHNAGGFGLSGSDNVITCGSYTTDGSGNATVNLGYEPQWVLIKPSSTTGDWRLWDNMRPFTTTAADYLAPNLSSAEQSNSYWFQLRSTGFYSERSANTTYIYIAIRRGPMKTPTSGTSVYNGISFTGNDTSGTRSTGLNAFDLLIPKRTSASLDWVWLDKLRGLSGTTWLASNSTSAETVSGGTLDTINSIDGQRTQDGLYITKTSNYGYVDASGSTYAWYAMRRAPGFFDVVCYTGDGNSTQALNHNLAATPQFVIMKTRDAVYDWLVYSATTGTSNTLFLNLTNASTAYTVVSAVSASSFTVANVANNVTEKYVAYLFASCPGVSKVGSYTGTGTTLQVDCGFTGGARFVLIKRTDSTGGWYVWDSARGIVAGNDPYLLLNSTAAEVTNTDYVDTYSAGFEISSTAPAAINANGGTFIFLAIA